MLRNPDDRTIPMMLAAAALAPCALVAPAAAQTQPIEEAALLASDGLVNDRFGYSVAVSGDTAVVGAIGDDGARGAAYVFVRDGAGWSQQAKLLSGLTSGQFGLAVALDGDTAVIGALDSTHGTQSGSAYVFTRSGTTWSQQQLLLPGAPGELQWFGWSVALDGDTALVGAPRENDWDGAVYVFARSGTTWSETARVVPTSGYAGGDSFGRSVALDLGAETLVAGAPYDAGTGSVFVFVRSGTSWSQQAKLLADDGAGNDAFGGSVALAGDRVLAGVSLDDHGPDLNAAGSAYVFERSGTSWTQEAKLVARDPLWNDQLGQAVALLGDKAVVGAPKDDDACAFGVFCNSGAAYVFTRDGTSWSETAKLTAGDAASRRHFGYSLAADGDALLVGTDTGPVTDVGTGWAYVFRDVASPFASFCDDSDGALALCPCANPGRPDAGCDNRHGTGGVKLQATSFLPDVPRVALLGTGFPPERTPAVVVIRGESVESTPVVFGDGLRCAGLAIVRLSGVSARNGWSGHTIGHGVGSGTFHYQLWYRNTPDAFCDPAAGWNLSNALSIEWP